MQCHLAFEIRLAQTESNLIYEQRSQFDHSNHAEMIDNERIKSSLIYIAAVASEHDLFCFFLFWGVCACCKHIPPESMYKSQCAQISSMQPKIISSISVANVDFMANWPKIRAIARNRLSPRKDSWQWPIPEYNYYHYYYYLGKMTSKCIKKAIMAWCCFFSSSATVENCYCSKLWAQF